MSDSIKITFLLILLSIGPYLHAQQYNFIKYSIQEGLPQSQVYAGFQDSRGYIWFGTQGGGVSRFDGETFDNFTTKNGLPSNYVNTIVEDSHGRIWVGSNAGIGYFDSGKFKTLPTEDSTVINIRAMIVASDSSLWIGTQRGIYRYRYGEEHLQKLYLHKRLDIFGVNDFLLQPDGIWVATNGGVFFVGKNVQRYTVKNGLKGNVNVSLLLDASKRLWVASYNGGLSVFDRKQQAFKSYDAIPNIQKPIYLYEDEDDCNHHEQEHC